MCPEATSTLMVMQKVSIRVLFSGTWCTCSTRTKTGRSTRLSSFTCIRPCSASSAASHRPRHQRDSQLAPDTPLPTNSLHLNHGEMNSEN